MKKMGWIWWLLVATALYLFENNTGTRVVLLTALLLPAVSVLSVFVSQKKASVTLISPETCARGEQVKLTLSVSGLPPLARANVSVKVINQLTGEQTVMHAEQGDLLLTTSHCGMLCISADCEITDLFGLTHGKSVPCDEIYVQVMPMLRPALRLADATAVVGEAEESGAKNRSAEWNDPVSYREYQPGDPIRLIHWKLSQKTDHLMLREMAASSASDGVLLVFDAANRSADKLDAMAGELFSLSREFVDVGIPYTVVWQDERSMTPYIHPVLSLQDERNMEAAFFCTRMSHTEEPEVSSILYQFEQVIRIGTSGIEAESTEQ